MKQWTILAVIAAAAVAGYFAWDRAPMKPGAIAGSKAAPDFTLKNIDGITFTLSKETKGKVVLLNFWATWCPPCRMEIPGFIKLYEKYRSKGLVIVGVAMDEGGAADVSPFVKSNGMNYPILVGEQSVVESYGGITGIPTTFFIDRQGAISQKIIGAREDQFFEQEIMKLL